MAMRKFIFFVIFVFALSVQAFAETPGNIPAWLTAGLEAEDMCRCAPFSTAEWYAQAASRNLPALGDEWFIPGFIEDCLRGDIERVAYYFVQYLRENGDLDGLIELYRQGLEELNADSIREAGNIRAAAWASFTGTAVNVPGVVFQYIGGDVVEIVYNFFVYPIEVGFFALANHCWYFFTPSGWAREHVHNYIGAGEESAAFLGELLGYTPSEALFAVIRGGEHSNRGGGYAIGRILVVHTDIDFPPMVFTHELAHVMLAKNPDIRAGGLPLAPYNFRVMGMDEDFNSHTIDFFDVRINGRGLNDFTLNDDIMPYLQEFAQENGFYGGINAMAFSLFEEGLCVVLENLFLAYTQNEWYALGVSAGIFFNNILDEDSGRIYPTAAMRYNIERYTQQGGYATLEEFIYAQLGGGDIEEAMQIMFTLPERRATRAEIIASVHARALMQDMANNDFSNTALFGYRYGILNGYFTAGSFIFYLLEHRGTMEDFLLVYSDLSQMEYVYGITTDEMIESWLAYLDTRFSAEFVEYFEWRQAYNERYAHFSLEWQIQMLMEYAELMGLSDDMVQMIIEQITERQ